MSILDKVAAAVAPAASQEDMMKARQKAEQISAGEPWLREILEHHKKIEGLLEQVINGPDANARREALRDFSKILAGHSIAEEMAVYPGVTEISKAHGAMAYEEQSMAKIQSAKMEKLDPMSQEWRDKGEHIRSAIQQHVYQEEDSWYPELANKLSANEKQHITSRYNEEYERYCGSDDSSSSSGVSRTATQSAL